MSATSNKMPPISNGILSGMQLSSGKDKQTEKKTDIKLLLKQPRTAKFTLTWESDFCKSYQTTVVFSETLRGAKLRDSAAKRLNVSPREVILKQKKGYRQGGGAPLVFTAQGTYATSGGRIVPEYDVKSKAWILIDDEDEIQLAGDLELHMMFSIKIVSSPSTSSNSED